MAYKRKIPRPKGRGLIEAGRARRGSGRRPEIPRPKGRGLIEAAGCPDRAHSGGADSAAERSRPH